MKRLLAMTLVLAMLVVGCGPKSSTGGGEGGENIAAVQEWNTIYSGELTTLNYLTTASANEFSIAANLVDTLIDYDKYGVEQPALAESWTVSDDDTVWTFNLRKGVQWVTYDGQDYAEMKAKDFVDALEYVLNPANESQTANIAYSVINNAEEFYNGEISDFSQVGIKAIDDYTVEYTLKQPTPYFLSMLTYVCFFPVNGDFVAEVGDKFGTDNKNILYNGAFTMPIFEPQTRRVMEANEKYWDKDNIHIERINYTYNKEASTLAPEMFLRGETDITSVPSTILDEWMKDPAKESQIRPNRTGFYTYFYCLNFDPQFPAEYEPANWKLAVNNVNFRKALFHGLNRRSAMLTEEPYDPDKRILNTITPRNFVDFEGTDYTELGSLANFTNSDSFDEAKALEFKEKAMAELDGKVTFPVKVLMPYNTSQTELANRVQVIEQQMENLLGKDFIDIIIDPKPPTGFLKEVRRAGQYALLECNWGPDYADPETYTGPFIEGSYNWPELAEGYTEANGKTKYENMVAEAMEELHDIEKRYSLFAEAEAFLIGEAMVIPYAVSGGGYTASKLNPFESPYSPFGISSERYKGQKVMERAMNTAEFNEGLVKWEAERAEALKKNAK